MNERIWVTRIPQSDGTKKMIGSISKCRVVNMDQAEYVRADLYAKRQAEIDEQREELSALSDDRDLCAEANIELEEKLSKCRAQHTR